MIKYICIACTYEIIPDQIETGTYMIAAAAAGGNVTLQNVIPRHMEALTQVLRDCGVDVEEKTCTSLHRRPSAVRCRGRL